VKTLLLMRHAKAQPDSGDDKARQLEPEGREDAQRVGRFMRDLLGAPEAIVASDAVRAHQTAEIVAAALDASDRLTLNPDAYTFETEPLRAVLRSAPDVATVLLIAHSPALEGVTGQLVGTNAREVALPPAGFAHLTFETDDWAAIEPGSARLMGMVTPATVP
jgi:phosphohistidine phosphatase